MTSGSLKLPRPSGPVQACTGTAVQQCMYLLMNRSKQEQNQIKIRKNTILITHYTLSEKENIRFSSYATHIQWLLTATVNSNWRRIDVLLLPARVRPLWATQDSASTKPDTYLILIWDKPIVTAHPTAPHCSKRCFKQSAIDKYDIWNPGQNKIPLSPADVKPLGRYRDNRR